MRRRVFVPLASCLFACALAGCPSDGPVRDDPVRDDPGMGWDPKDGPAGEAPSEPVWATTEGHDLRAPELEGIARRRRFMGQPVFVYQGGTSTGKTPLAPPSDRQIKAAVARGWVRAFRRGTLPKEQRPWLELELQGGVTALWTWKPDKLESYGFVLQVPYEGDWRAALARLGCRPETAAEWKLQGALSLAPIEGGPPADFPLFDVKRSVCSVGFRPGPNPRVCLVWSRYAFAWGNGYADENYVFNEKLGNILKAEVKARVRPLLLHAREVGCQPAASTPPGWVAPAAAEAGATSAGPEPAPKRPVVAKPAPQRPVVAKRPPAKAPPAKRPPAKRPRPAKPRPAKRLSPTSPRGWPFPILGVDDQGQAIPRRDYGVWRRAGASGATSQPAGPVGGVGAAMAFVPERRGCVLVGGYRPGKIERGTWLFDGQGWSQLPLAGGPQGVAFLDVAYDRRREVLVAFGGVTQQAQLVDTTWELSAKGWREVPLKVRPPKRGKHRMAYDEARGVVVLYGGQGADAKGQMRGDELRDTWEYDGRAWRKVATSEQAPRNNLDSVLVYDRQRKALVIQGGKFPLMSGLPFASTFDGTTWKQVPKVDITTGFAQHGAVYDSDARRVAFVVADEEELRIASFSWSLGRIHAPLGSRGGCPARAGFACAYDPLRKRIVVFGGIHKGRYLRDTWTLGDDSQEDYDAELRARAPGWERVAPALVAGRRVTGRAFAADPRTGEALLFGGQVELGGGRRSLQDETWRWQGGSWQRQRPRTSPPARAGGLLFRQGARWVLVGGRANKQQLSDVWAWEGGEWTRLGEVQGQHERFFPTPADYAYDPTREQLVLISAYGTRSWTLDTKSWRWRKGPGVVEERKGHFEGGLVYHPGAKQLLAMGRLRQGLRRSLRAYGWTGEGWQAAPDVPAFDGSLSTLALDAKHRALWSLGDGFVHGLRRGWQSYAAPKERGSKGVPLVLPSYVWSDPQSGLLYVLGAASRASQPGKAKQWVEETWAFDPEAGRRVSAEELQAEWDAREAFFSRRYKMLPKEMRELTYGPTPEGPPASRPARPKPARPKPARPKQQPKPSPAESEGPDPVLLADAQDMTWTGRGLLVTGPGYVELRDFSGRATRWRRELAGMQSYGQPVSAGDVAFAPMGPQVGTQHAPRGLALDLASGATLVETPFSRAPRVGAQGERLDLLVKADGKSWEWRAWDLRRKTSVEPLPGLVGLEQERYLFYDPREPRLLVGGREPRVVDLESGEVTPVAIPRLGFVSQGPGQKDSPGFTRAVFLPDERVALGGWLKPLPAKTGWQLAWVIHTASGRALGRFPELPEGSSLGLGGKLAVGKAGGVVFFHPASAEQLAHWKVHERSEWKGWNLSAARLGPKGQLALKLTRPGAKPRVLVYPPSALTDVQDRFKLVQAATRFVKLLVPGREETAKAQLNLEPRLFKWTGRGGVTLMHHAAARGLTKVVTAFLDQGVSVDAATDRGQTPLIMASGQGHAAVVKLLLERGADPSRFDGNKMDAFAVAIVAGKAQVAQLLAAKRPRSLQLIAQGRWGALHPNVRARYEQIRGRPSEAWGWLKHELERARAR